VEQDIDRRHKGMWTHNQRILFLWDMWWSRHLDEIRGKGEMEQQERPNVEGEGWKAGPHRRENSDAREVKEKKLFQNSDTKTMTLSEWKQQITGLKVHVKEVRSDWWAKSAEEQIWLTLIDTGRDSRADFIGWGFWWWQRKDMRYRLCPSDKDRYEWCELFMTSSIRELSLDWKTRFQISHVQRISWFSDEVKTMSIHF
jgi:hypothetical protein